jgi:hypothetical protein
MLLAVRSSRALLVLVALALATGGRGLAQVPSCVTPPPGMVAWWPGDGNARDLAGANAATLVGGAAFAPGRVDRAFSLDGSTAWVEVPDAAPLRVTSALTIDAWINPTATGGRVVDKITAGGGDGYLLDTWGGVIRFLFDGQTLSGATPIPTGVWSHVAGVYDGAEMRVYLNGTLDGTRATSAAIPTNALPLRIGAASNGGSLFSGLIDEVEVFDRGLSQAEIQAIVAAGSAGKCKPAVVVAVPAVSAWGLAGLALLLAAGAIRVLRPHG